MKARNYNCKEKLNNAKKLATACVRAQRQRASISQKIMKESVWRAKRIAREVQVYTFCINTNSGYLLIH